jgi:glutathione synthase/RimK-type ligase-like ATP-grasp enzyme
VSSPLSASRDIVLITGNDMPVPDTESRLVVEALAARGVDAAVEPWGTEASSRARLVVIRSAWDYTSRHVEFITWAREVDAATTLVNPIGVLEWNSHKSYLLDLAYAAVPVVPTALVTHASPDSDQRAALQEYEGEVVIKPAVSVGAMGALRAPALSVEAADHLRALVAEGDALVQPFEATIVDGEVSLVYFDGEPSHAVRKVPAAGDYRVQPHLGGRLEHHHATAEEREVATAALVAVGADLAYARVDLVAAPRGPVVMELELIEPALYLDYEPGSADRFAEHLADLLP